MLAGGGLDNRILCQCMAFRIKQAQVDAVGILRSCVYLGLRERNFPLRGHADFAPLGVARVTTGAFTLQRHFVAVVGGNWLQVAAVPRDDEQATLPLQFDAGLAGSSGGRALPNQKHKKKL